MDKEIFAWYTKDLPRNSVKRACYVVREFLRYTKVTQNQETGTLECEVLPGCAVTFEEYEEARNVILSYAYQNATKLDKVELFVCDDDCIQNDYGNDAFCKGEFSLHSKSLNLCPYYMDSSKF